MTKERLYQYCSLQRQIKIFDKRYNVSFISAVDTTKPSVQSGNNSNATADQALRMVSKTEKEDYQKITKEFEILNNYIFGIKDELTKELFKRVFVYEQPYWYVSNEVGLTVRAIQYRIDNYIKEH